MDYFDDYMAFIGSRIRFERETLGISLRKFSLMIGIHRNYLVDVELGRANPSLDILLKIAGGLEIQLWELLNPYNHE